MEDPFGGRSGGGGSDRSRAGGSRGEESRYWVRNLHWSVTALFEPVVHIEAEVAGVVSLDLAARRERVTMTFGTPRVLSACAALAPVGPLPR
jgi:hypothetical protein